MNKRYSGLIRHIVLIITAVLLTAAVNIFVSLLSDKYPLALDLTENGRYSLSEENKAFLKSLDREVDIYILSEEKKFVSASTYTEYAASLLRQYPMYGPVSVSYVDYLRDPTFTAQYPDVDLHENDILLVCRDRRSVVQVSDLFEYSYTSADTVCVSAIGEAKLAEAITDVVSDSRSGAVFISGNGVHAEEGLEELLTANGFDVSRQPLMAGDFAPEAALAVIAGPADDYTDEQIEVLDSWLRLGGKTLFVSFDVMQSPCPKLESYLSEWGALVDDGSVFETDASKTSQNQPFYAIAAITDAALSENFADAGMPVLSPLARPLSLRFAVQENYSAEEILSFSETCGVRPSGAGSDFSASDAVRRGPIPAMIRCTLESSSKAPSVIYVCGSVSFTDDSILRGNAFLNRRFLTKLFSGIGGADTSNFVSRQISEEKVYIPTSAANTLGIVLSIVLPLLMLAAGAAVFIRRRRL